MPIFVMDNHTQLSFGLGDILVSPGLLKMDDDELKEKGPTGVVIFQQQEPKLVGERVEYETDIEVGIEETPIRMTFTKSESIDVVIDALSRAKTMMLNNSTREVI